MWNLGIPIKGKVWVLTPGGYTFALKGTNVKVKNIVILFNFADVIYPFIMFCFNFSDCIVVNIYSY